MTKNDLFQNVGNILSQAAQVVDAISNQNKNKPGQHQHFTSRCDLSLDSKFLNALGLMEHSYEPGYCRANMDEVAAEINAVIYNLRSTRDGFTSTHFLVKANTDGTNEYSVGNWAQPECPREAMLGMIANAAGQPDFNIQDYL